MQQTPFSCNNCLSRVQAGATSCPYCGQTFANTNPAGTLPVNTVLAARYTVGKCAVLDGEGVTYHAIDGQKNTRVLLKEYVPVTICAARTPSGEVIARDDSAVLFKTTRMDFIDLYTTLVQLGEQPGLVQVFDLFEENNTAYAVRAPENGVSLRTYLQKQAQSLTAQQALELLGPVVQGVQAMHSKGLVHRGISLDTVFVDDAGRAKLGGYATIGVRTADSELRNQIFEGFAAPEQYSTAEFDGNYTDVYALGALFYRAVTGRVPASAPLRRKEDTLTPPRSLESVVPAYYSTAIMRALRLPAAERTQSAAAFLQALTEPEKSAAAFAFTERQKKYLLMGVVALSAVAVFSLIAYFVLSNVTRPSPSSSETSSASENASDSQSGAQTILLPNFMGRQYTEVQQNAEYRASFLFVVEERTSSDYAAGEIISQYPSPGAEVEIGTMIELVVSKGAQTALMPVVTTLTLSEATAVLRALGIQYTLLYMENDGTYEAGTVAKTDVPAGTEIDINKTNVALYIAKEAPIPPESDSSSSSSEPTPPSSSEDEDKSEE